MKKVLTIIAIITILLSVSIISNAALELTEDNLSTLLDEICRYKKTVEVTSEDGTQTSSVTVDFEDVTYKTDKNLDTITLDMEDTGEVIVEYNLENTKSIKFTYNLSFDKQMNAEDFETEVGKGVAIGQMLFSMVAKNEGILPEDSYSYILNQNFKVLFEKLIIVGTSYSDGITNAKLMYNGDLNISNEFMEFIYEKESETTEEYNIKATLEIKKSADFSKLEGYAVKSLKEGFADASTNKKENIVSNQISNSLESTNNNQEKNVVANIQKIPQTGNEISLQKILYSVIATATLVGICLAIYSKKTSK